MRLRNIHFFLQKQLFAYKQYKNTINGTSLHPSFHGLEVREWPAMPEVPGSRLTQVKQKTNTFTENFLFFKFFQKITFNTRNV